MPPIEKCHCRKALAPFVGLWNALNNVTQIGSENLNQPLLQGLMMKSLMLKFVALIAGVLFAFGAIAQERATKDEAVAMVESAIALIKSAGAEKAAKDFMSDAKWKKKDLYISMYQIKDGKVVVVAHGINEKLVGKDITDLKDADDKLFLREAMTKAAKGGWVEYKWPDPATKKVHAKSSYIKAASGTDYAILVGVYQ